MYFGKAPKLLSFSEMRPISFTEFTSMSECILKGVLKHRGVFKHTHVEKITTKNLICGYIFHTLMSDLKRYLDLPQNSRRMAIRKDIDLYIKKYSEKYPDFEFKDYLYWSQLEKSIGSVLCKTKSDLKKTVAVEKKIISIDGSIVGVIDLLEKSNSNLELIDYKSKLIDLSIELPDKYTNQLHYYAFLVEESYGAYSGRC